MLNLSKIYATALFSLSSCMLLAQTGNEPQVLKNEEGNIYFARVRPDEAKPLQEAPAFLHSFLQAQPGHAFRIKREEKDKLGMTHQRYDQYFQGVKIEGAEYLVHSRQGVIQSVNGDLEDITLPSVTPRIHKGDALKAALAAVPAAKYGWEDSFSENRYKEVSDNPNATLYPTPELVIYKNAVGQAYKLVYKIHVVTAQPHGSFDVYVDANTGKVVDKTDLLCHVNVSGSAATLYSGQQAITVDSYSAGFYRLRETRTGPAGSAQINTFDIGHGTIPAYATDFSSTSPNFSTPDAGHDVHWATEKTFDYFNTVLGRNSYSNTGKAFNSYVHYGLGYDNASWDPDNEMLLYGDGQQIFRSVTGLDIVAHEIGHAVCKYSADLNRAGESHSLNEGLSDIWAACVTSWAWGVITRLPIILVTGLLTANPTPFTEILRF
jgi:bacillolysin